MCSAPMRAQVARELGALLGRAGGEALADLAAVRVDAQLAPGLGVDEPQVADRGQLLLARVAHLERDHVMAVQQPQQRLAPVARAAEVGDDDDQPARARQAPGAQHRVGEVGRARRRPARVPTRSVSSSRSRPCRPCSGGTTRASRAPNVITPSRLPWRVARCPTASAAPSATSALRRSAVPKLIEAETSSSSHVASVRSATCTRTCGSPRARGRSPVDLAHVVAELVRAHLRDLGAVPQRRRAVLTRDQRIDAPPHGQVEALDDRRRRLRSSGSGIGIRGHQMAPAPRFLHCELRTAN